MDLILPYAMIVGAYLVGALPFGWLIARARGVDIFAHGSGNIGATNVGRVLGRKFGLLVFALDFAKGAVPVAAALGVRGWLGESFWRQGWLEIAAGLAAFLGHCFPIYLSFRGGKGVATGAGVVAVLVPVAALAALMAWLVVVGVWRYVSLASVVAALVLCVVQLTVYPPFAPPTEGGDDRTVPRSAFCIVAAVLVIARHRANLVRLSQGKENRLPEGAAMSQLPKSLHVLALGLWFGMIVFFTFPVALTLFDTFEKLGQRPADDRPDWFPLGPEFAKSDIEINGPKEQGTRAAGHAVGPMFTWYFLLQVVCGLVAAATSLAWMNQGKAHRWRTGLLIFALLTVLAGWPLERYVSDLRPARDAAVDAYLRADSASAPSARAAMHEARGRFGGWHTVSLFLNFATILAVTGAMALAGNLPEVKRES